MDENVAGAGCFSLVGILVLVASIVAGGLFRTEISYIPQSNERIGEEVAFDESLTARHWLLGLVKGRQPDLQTALDQHVRSGERITQVTIVSRHSVLNNLVCGITIAIYCPQTVDIHAKVGKVVVN